MERTATALALLAVFFLGGAGCRHVSPQELGPGPAALPSPGALLPSPRLLVGRVIAVDAHRGFAMVELSGDAPGDALAEGSELLTRTGELLETARLRPTRYRRGRTLGCVIVSGRPAVENEVVWIAP